MAAPPAQPRPPATGDPYAVFRPRRGRLVATVAAIVSVLVFTGGAFSLPEADPLVGGWGLPDRLALAACGYAIALLLWRYATIRATPSREGVVVRNLFTTRRLEWAQIVRVDFGGGAPWVSVELDDTDIVAVMAIQKADGPLARREAGRLSALVQGHGARGPRRPPADQR